MTHTQHSSPFVTLNAAMSLDGKIATFTGDSRLSSTSDIKRVHRLRASVDAIMVGLRTLLVDDPKLTVESRASRKRSPYRIIVDSRARSPLTSYVVKTAREIPTIIATTATAPSKRIEMLQRNGVTVLICGKGPRVSLRLLLKRLKTLRIRTIMLEGGGALNWSMLHDNLVDEISVAITPKIIGGINATSLVEGKGNALVKDGTNLKLVNVAKYGPDLVVRYKVLNRTSSVKS